MPTVHLLIKGRVQGVFYRASAKGKAIELNLTGWIRNTRENAVEAVASGTEVNIELFVDWCKKGPSNAVVKSVEITQVEENFFDSFLIRRE
jgi:acylphosphatase